MRSSDVTPGPGGEGGAGGEEGRLRKSLGFFQLTAIGFSGVIGSGWLLGAMYAAQYAGPEAIVSWVIGGVVLALIALVMAALGGARPEAGGLVRWPFYTSGRFVATMAGWGIWIAWATNPPSESAAMIQYMSKYVGGIFSNGSLTGLGLLLGVGLMAVFVALNWFGIQLFARVNGALTWHELRIALPILLIGVLVYAYQHWRAGAPWADARLGLWLVAYLALVLLMSGIGSADFEGTNWVPAPWDSVIVAVIALAAWLAGVRAGSAHLLAHPAADRDERPSPSWGLGPAAPATEEPPR